MFILSHRKAFLQRFFRAQKKRLAQILGKTA